MEMKKVSLMDNIFNPFYMQIISGQEPKNIMIMQANGLA